jgi:hypothetical protein
MSRFLFQCPMFSTETPRPTLKDKQITQIANRQPPFSYLTSYIHIKNTLSHIVDTTNPKNSTSSFVTYYITHIYPCQIWGFNDGDYEEYYLLGCDAVWLLLYRRFGRTCDLHFFHPYNGGNCSSEISILIEVALRHIPENDIYYVHSVLRHSIICCRGYPNSNGSHAYKSSLYVKQVSVIAQRSTMFARHTGESRTA